MLRWLAGIGLCCVLISRVAAENTTIIWKEPTANGTLASTTVYWCTGTNCIDWKSETGFRCGSQNGNGGRIKKLTLIIPLVQGSLPVTLRLKVTATDINSNETAGVIGSHTFSN